MEVSVLSAGPTDLQGIYRALLLCCQTLLLILPAGLPVLADPPASRNKDSSETERKAIFPDSEADWKTADNNQGSASESKPAVRGSYESYRDYRGDDNPFSPEALPPAGAGPKDYKDYGAAGGLIGRIEALLSNSQHTLKENDCREFQGQFETLKQSVTNELSRGASGQAIVQPLQSLESQIHQRLHDAVDLQESMARQFEVCFFRVETLLKLRGKELSPDNAQNFQTKLADLKMQSAQASLSLEAFEKLTRAAADLELQLRDMVMRTPYKGSLVYTRGDDNGAGKLPDRPPLEVQGTDRDRQSSRPPLRNANVVQVPRKLSISIPVLIQQIENRLIDFHDRHQIGSFDMDSFTERLLAQKVNLHVMMSKTGRISARQEVIVRSELEQLFTDLMERVTVND
jgi:hypothetical protein